MPKHRDVKVGDTLLRVPRHNYSGPAYQEVKVRKVLKTGNILLEGDTQHQWRPSYQDTFSATGEAWRRSAHVYLDSPERRAELQAEYDGMLRERRAQNALSSLQTIRASWLDEEEVAALERIVADFKARQSRA